jgi:hypothetical protein
MREGGAGREGGKESDEMSASCYEDLREHIGHDIVCIGYGDGHDFPNVSLECETCGCVLLDFDEGEK